METKVCDTKSHTTFPEDKSVFFSSSISSMKGKRPARGVASQGPTCKLVKPVDKINTERGFRSKIQFKALSNHREKAQTWLGL